MACINCMKMSMEWRKLAPTCCSLCSDIHPYELVAHLYDV